MIVVDLLKSVVAAAGVLMVKGVEVFVKLVRRVATVGRNVDVIVSETNTCLVLFEGLSIAEDELKPPGKNAMAGTCKQTTARQGSLIFYETY